MPMCGQCNDIPILEPSAHNYWCCANESNKGKFATRQTKSGFDSRIKSNTMHATVHLIIPQLSLVCLPHQCIHALTTLALAGINYTVSTLHSSSLLNTLPASSILVNCKPEIGCDICVYSHTVLEVQLQCTYTVVTVGNGVNGVHSILQVVHVRTVHSTIKALTCFYHSEGMQCPPSCCFWRPLGTCEVSSSLIWRQEVLSHQQWKHMSDTGSSTRKSEGSEVSPGGRWI